VTTVRDYYEHNTRTFLRLGREQVIHRALWGPGADTLPDALHFAHRRIAAELRPLGPDAVALDLGCGVGASCCFLAAQTEARLVGISISETQVALAEALAASRGLADRCRFVVGDFCDLPAIGPVGAAYAIEAFAHAPDTDAFFRSVAARLAPGGLLILVDDFLAADADPAHPTVRRFVDGWRVPAVARPAEVAAAAERHGLALVQDEDWTAYVRLWRPRDRLLHWLQPLIRLGAPHDAWLQSLVGGDALQVGLATGLLRHRWLVFRAL
jgi:cyclopropane fatty-acyl-phospholipid synthase-like methyltransferase